MENGKEKTDKKIKIAAIGDVHMSETSRGSYRETLLEISQKADVLCLCGDLTDHGYSAEAEMLAEELQACTIPIVGVLGNHDYDQDQVDPIKEALKSRMTVLDGESVEVAGVGFAGIKGYGGGFGDLMLSPFGESPLKDFVNVALDQVLKLEKALSQLETTKKVVLLHYSPIRETVVGEPEEIFPFLGTTRLEEPINAYNASVAFHAHAHFGHPEGKTLKGVPVYNVSKPLLVKMNPKQPYALVEL